MIEAFPVLPQYSKWIMTAILSIISVILFLVFRTYARKKVMIAMLLSSLGDIFMTDAFGLGSTVSGVPGAAFFIAAHIVYATCFTSLTKQYGYKYKNAGFYVGLILTAVSAVILIVFACLSENPQYGMLILILIYIAIIGWNIVSNFSYSFSNKGARLIFLPFAILLFYLTDIWIFLDMLNIYSGLHGIVWYFYPEAQLLLIIFCESFRKKNEPEYRFVP